MFGSAWLSNELSSLRYALGPTETTRFKQSVVEHEDTLSLLDSLIEGGSFTHFIADNIDHNLSTLDGRNTAFHAMGIIAATTPEDTQSPGCSSANRLPAVKRYKLKTAKVATHTKLIPIHYYDPPSEAGLSKVFFKEMLQLKRPTRKQSTELLISSLFYCISFRKSAFHSAGYLENKFLSKCGWVCIIGPRLIGPLS